MPELSTVPPDTLLLALNSGSSSLKLGLFRAGENDVEQVAAGSAEGVGRVDGQLHLQAADGTVLAHEAHVMESQKDAFSKLARVLEQHFPASPAAVGHRFVHGGPALRQHQPLTAAVEAQLQQAIPIAPLHIPMALALAEQARAVYPKAQAIACFDTAFHRTIPAVAAHLPIPAAIAHEGVTRYGFHGLSYESIVFRLSDALPQRAIFAHLGSGASVVAVHNGQSVDTTMSFTPTSGIAMSTRSGDLDPGVLLYLMRQHGMDAAALEGMLDAHSGLAGIAGEGDMQALLARAERGDAAAQLAVDLFCYGVRKTAGAYAAALGGVDLLVFTGGIGEHSQPIRRKICTGLDFLGLRESAAGETGPVRVLPAEEEKQIARHCKRLLMSTHQS